MNTNTVYNQAAPPLIYISYPAGNLKSSLISNNSFSVLHFCTLGTLLNKAFYIQLYFEISLANLWATCVVQYLGVLFQNINFKMHQLDLTKI